VKDKKTMTISIHAVKAFNDVLHVFIIKTFKKL
jgi:hypothetical protein